VIVCRSVLLRIRNVSDKSCRENQNTTFVISNFFFKPCLLEDSVEKFVESDRPPMTIWRTRIACWIRKSTHTLWECIILMAFPLLQWFHERNSVSRDTYTALPVLFFYQPGTEYWVRGPSSVTVKLGEFVDYVSGFRVLL
jgi:hypothetical protein